MFGKRPVIGRVDETSLRVCKRNWYRNSFQTYLSAELVEAGGGTGLHCRFGTHPIVRAFIAAWFVVVLVMGATATLLVRHSPGVADTPHVSELVSAVPFALAAFGFLMVGFGRWLARGEKRFLVGFLQRTIEARAA